MITGIGYEVTPEMEAYGKSCTGIDRDPMKCLYESADWDDISRLVSVLVLVSILQDEVRVVPEDEKQVAKAGDMAVAGVMCARYAAFVCRFNRNFDRQMFSNLFRVCVTEYSGHWSGAMDEFANLADGWKKGFEDALILRLD